MFKFRCRSEKYLENAVVILCERFLARVFQYMYFWVNDTEIAEELTLKALKKALVKHGYCSKDEKKFSTEIFNCARNEVQDYLKVSAVKPVLPGLSIQEQEVISLKLAAALDNRMISRILGVSELITNSLVRRSLCKLSDHPENSPRIVL